MSNIRVRSKLEFYPHDGEGSSSEFWHGDKMFDSKCLSQLTPMAVSSCGTYYVDEVCRLADSTLFVPDVFFRRRGELWARGYQLKANGPVS
jgi:hypothetical protein